MTIYSLYIFDRHCECVYFHNWQRIAPIRPGKTGLAGVAPEVSQVPSPSANVDEQPTARLQALGLDDGRNTPIPPRHPPPIRRGLPFDEEAKLVYGVVFSLRNMVKKLSGKEDEAFIAYRTSSYKMHLYETPSGYKFVLFSDPAVESLRFVLKSIYQSAFIDFVVRNPMIELDSKKSGSGIDNQAFRTAVHTFVTGLSVYR